MTNVTVITPEARAAIALESNVVENQLIVLVEKSKHITSITNNDGCKQVHASRMDLKNARVAIQSTSKEARSDATAFSKAVIAEEKRLVDIIANEEVRLNALETAWEAEKERVRRERDEAEKARVDAINTAIKEITVHGCTQLSESVEIQQAIAKLNAIVITDEMFAEMTSFANISATETHVILSGLLAAALDKEAYEEAIKAERLRIDAEAAELAEKQRAYQKEAAVLAEKQRAEQAAIAKERELFNKQKADYEAEVAKLAEAARLEAERIKATPIKELVDKIVNAPEYIEAREKSIGFVESVIASNVLVQPQTDDAFTATLNAPLEPVSNVVHAFPRHEPLSEVEQLVKDLVDLCFQYGLGGELVVQKGLEYICKITLDPNNLTKKVGA